MSVNFLPPEGAPTLFLWNDGSVAGTGHFTNTGDVFSPDPETKLNAFAARYVGDQASRVRGPNGEEMAEDLFTTYKGGNLKFPAQGENEGKLGAAMRRGALDPQNPFGMKPEGDGFPTILEILDAAATTGFTIIERYPAPSTGDGDDAETLRRKLADAIKAREDAEKKVLVREVTLEAERKAYVTLRDLLESVLTTVAERAIIALNKAPEPKGGIPARTLHATGKALEALVKQTRVKM